MSYLKGTIVGLLAILVFLPLKAQAIETRCSDIQLIYYYQGITTEYVDVTLERPYDSRDIRKSMQVILNDGSGEVPVQMSCPSSSRPVLCPADDYENCHEENTNPIHYWCYAQIDVAHKSNIKRIEVTFEDSQTETEYTCTIHQDMFIAPEMMGKVTRTLDGIDIDISVNELDWVSVAKFDDEDYCIPEFNSDGTEVYRCQINQDSFDELSENRGGSVYLKSEPIVATSPSDESDIMDVVKVKYLLPELDTVNNPSILDCPENAVATTDGNGCECDDGFVATEERLCKNRFMFNLVGNLHVMPFFTDSDGDGVSDVLDECPGYDDKKDMDEDGIADDCDDDLDGDGILNLDDDCPDEHAINDQDVDGCEDDQDEETFNVVPGGQNVGDNTDGNDDNADNTTANDSSSGNSSDSNEVDIWGGGACSLTGAAAVNPFAYLFVVLSLAILAIPSRIRSN